MASLRSLTRILLALAFVPAALIVCGTAGAEILVVGAPLDGDGWMSKACESPGCAFLNNYGRAPAPGIPPVWPSTPTKGVIVRLNVLGATTPGQYRVRTVIDIHHSPFVEYEFLAASPPLVAVPSAGVHTYEMSMPVSSGNSIALSMSEGASIGFQEGINGYTGWASDPPQSGLLPFDSSGPGLVGFNVEIQPPPSISSIGGSRGPATGGTALAITGYNLEGATSVTFGSSPASSFTAVSEHQVNAVAPPSATAGKVPVSITTPAGTATAQALFTYEQFSGCRVPKLTGKRLEAARKALVRAGCGLGKVTKLHGAKARSGKVVRQSAPPGSEYAFAKVDVVLKPPKPAHKRYPSRRAR